MTTDSRPIRDFQIQVGHWKLRVRARGADEAIELARRKLSHELPRLYDVIRAMEPARFQIEDAA